MVNVNLITFEVSKTYLNNGEKIVVELFSNVYKNIRSDYKVKIDDIRHNIDIELARLNGVSEAIPKDDEKSEDKGIFR